MHLFFHCEFARAVLFAAPFGFRTDHFDHGLYPSNIITFLLASAHSEVSVHSVFATLWLIWKACNDLLFNRISWSVLQVHCAARQLAVGKEEEQVQNISEALTAATVPSPNTRGLPLFGWRFSCLL